MASRRTHPTKNQRRRRASIHRPEQHLLDVRIRASTARRQRSKRITQLLLCVLLWMAIGGSAFYGYHVLSQKFFFENPRYFIREVSVISENLLTQQEVLQITQIHLGQSIFTVNRKAAENALKQLSQVANATIKRKWPDELVIEVTPRHPVAWLATKSEVFSSETAYLVDKDGIIMRPERVQPSFWQLPVIYCQDLSLFLTKDCLATADLSAAIQLLAEATLQTSPELKLRSLDISKGYAIDATAEDGSRITFAPSQFEEQFERLEKLIRYCTGTGRQLESVNLIPKRNTPVRFVMAATALPNQQELSIRGQRSH